MTAGGSGAASPAPATYDGIATAYQRTRHAPVRRYVEAYTLFGLLGPVAGLAVLDLGCGDGWYARELRARGAGRVVGVDVSPGMLALAHAGAPDPGIEYHCLDAAALPVLGRFDLVLAAYLLHYAPTTTALAAMVAGLAANLRPGGRLVALVENPEPVPDADRRYAPYGFARTAPAAPVDGAPIRYALVAGRELVRFDTFYYSRATYAGALAAGGFGPAAWHPLALDPACADAGDPDWYAAYLAHPPVVGLTAVKAP